MNHDLPSVIKGLVEFGP